MIAFSTVDRDSFEAVKKWKDKVEAEVGSIAMVLVQNKVDLIDKAVSSNEEVRGALCTGRAVSRCAGWLVRRAALAAVCPVAWRFVECPRCACCPL